MKHQPTHHRLENDKPRKCHNLYERKSPGKKHKIIEHQSLCRKLFQYWWKMTAFHTWGFGLGFHAGFSKSISPITSSSCGGTGCFSSHTWSLSSNPLRTRVPWHIHLRAHALPHAHTWYHVIFSNVFCGHAATPQDRNNQSYFPFIPFIEASTGHYWLRICTHEFAITEPRHHMPGLKMPSGDERQEPSAVLARFVWLARPCWTKLGNQMVNTKGTKLVPPCILNFDPYPYDRWTWNVASGNAKSTHRGCQEYHQKYQSFFVTRQRPRNRALHIKVPPLGAAPVKCLNWCSSSLTLAASKTSIRGIYLSSPCMPPPTCLIHGDWHCSVTCRLAIGQI